MTARGPGNMEFTVRNIIIEEPIEKHRKGSNDGSVDTVDVGDGSDGVGGGSGLYAPYCHESPFMRAVFCGIVTDRTKFTFRPRSQHLMILLQLSQEMWWFGKEGMPYYQRVILFMRELFDRYKKGCQNHCVTVVLFTRLKLLNPLQKKAKKNHTAATQLSRHNDNESCDPVGQVCKNIRWNITTEDRYKVAWEGRLEHLLLTQEEFFSSLRRDLVTFPERIGWDAYCYNPSRLVSARYRRAVGRMEPSFSADGCLFEAMNLVVDYFNSHHTDRSLLLTGEAAIFVTAGNGFFYSQDRDLVELTKRRLNNSDIAPDIVCVRDVPLHQIPLLLIDRGVSCNELTGPLSDRFERQEMSWVVMHFFQEPENCDCEGPPEYQATSSFLPLLQVVASIRNTNNTSRRYVPPLTLLDQTVYASAPRVALNPFRNYIQKNSKTKGDQKIRDLLSTRWSHVYAPPRDGTMLWESLMQPALLPVTAEIFFYKTKDSPPVKQWTIQPSEILIKAFAAIMDNRNQLSGNRSSVKDDSVPQKELHTRLLQELVALRLQMGFQVNKPRQSKFTDAESIHPFDQLWYNAWAHEVQSADAMSFTIRCFLHPQLGPSPLVLDSSPRFVGLSDMDMCSPGMPYGWSSENLGAGEMLGGSTEDKAKTVEAGSRAYSYFVSYRGMFNLQKGDRCVVEQGTGYKRENTSKRERWWRKLCGCVTNWGLHRLMEEVACDGVELKERSMDTSDTSNMPPTIASSADQGPFAAVPTDSIGSNCWLTRCTSRFSRDTPSVHQAVDEIAMWQRPLPPQHLVIDGLCGADVKANSVHFAIVHASAFTHVKGKVRMPTPPSREPRAPVAAGGSVAGACHKREDLQEREYQSQIGRTQMGATGDDSGPVCDPADERERPPSHRNVAEDGLASVRDRVAGDRKESVISSSSCPVCSYAAVVRLRDRFTHIGCNPLETIPENAEQRFCHGGADRVSDGRTTGLAAAPSLRSTVGTSMSCTSSDDSRAHEFCQSLREKVENFMSALDNLLFRNAPKGMDIPITHRITIERHGRPSPSSLKTSSKDSTRSAQGRGDTQSEGHEQMSQLRVLQTAGRLPEQSNRDEPQQQQPESSLPSDEPEPGVTTELPEEDEKIKHEGFHEAPCPNPFVKVCRPSSALEPSCGLDIALNLPFKATTDGAGAIDNSKLNMSSCVVVSTRIVTSWLACDVPLVSSVSRLSSASPLLQSCRFASRTPYSSALLAPPPSNSAPYASTYTAAPSLYSPHEHTVELSRHRVKYNRTTTSQHSSLTRQIVLGERTSSEVRTDVSWSLSCTGRAGLGEGRSWSMCRAEKLTDGAAGGQLREQRCLRAGSEQRVRWGDGTSMPAIDSPTMGLSSDGNLFEWLYVNYDPVFCPPPYVFKLSIEWLVCGASVVSRLVRRIRAIAVGCGLSLVQVPAAQILSYLHASSSIASSPSRPSSSSSACTPHSFSPRVGSLARPPGLPFHPPISFTLPVFVSSPPSSQLVAALQRYMDKDASMLTQGRHTPPYCRSGSTDAEFCTADEPTCSCCCAAHVEDVFCVNIPSDTRRLARYVLESLLADCPGTSDDGAGTAEVTPVSSTASHSSGVVKRLFTTPEQHFYRTLLAILIQPPLSLLLYSFSCPLEGDSCGCTDDVCCRSLSSKPGWVLMERHGQYFVKLESGKIHWHTNYLHWRWTQGDPEGLPALACNCASHFSDVEWRSQRLRQHFAHFLDALEKVVMCYLPWVEDHCQSGCGQDVGLPQVPTG
eukprot:GHVQ01023365.1.p1 GENE.GHVQ01023365.1~~GHVQ01023365.1.p1  ORF type:complete len:1750 (+),score=235.22 GHVQ01023365.1:1003-6252(+)